MIPLLYFMKPKKSGLEAVNIDAISITDAMRKIRRRHTTNANANSPASERNSRFCKRSATGESLDDSQGELLLFPSRQKPVTLNSIATSLDLRKENSRKWPRLRSRLLLRALNWGFKTTCVMSLGWLLLAATMLGVIGILKAWEGIGSGVRVVETRLWETRINDLQAQLNLAESRARFLHRINVVEHPTGTGKLMVEIKENRQPEWFKVRGKDGRWTYRCFSELALQGGK